MIILNEIEFREELREKGGMINDFISSTLHQIEPEKLRSACDHIFKGGKRMRPALTLLVVESSGGSVEKAVPVASAIEILSGFTLIHDDIIDKDEKRRDKPTVHVIWGKEVAILAGDILHAITHDTIASMKTEKEKITVELSRLFAQTIKKMCEGEYYDIALQKGEMPPTVENYLKMVESKTASLMQAACVAGALISNVDQKRVKQFGEFGKLVGIAFQIRDDILGITANEQVLKKPVGSDIRERKITLPVIHFLQNSVQHQRILFESIFGKSVMMGGVNKIRDLFKATGSIEYAQNRACEYIKLAQRVLKDLNLNLHHHDRLSAFANFAVERFY